MIGLDLSGKTALVTGVGDDKGFAWAIAKTFQAMGAKVWLMSHPRTVGIVQKTLKRGASQEGRKFPHGVEGLFEPAGIIACDVEYDTADEMPAEVRETRGYEGDASIAGAFAAYAAQSGGAPIDVLVHAIGFTPEPQKSHLEVSRRAYLQAMSVSAYSLVALTRAALPMMEGRSASIIGLSYLAAERVVHEYGGGMASAKAALESDARNLAFWAGKHGHRVNIVSPGPFPSRAAKSIGDIELMAQRAAVHSPIQRAITAQDVADTVAFLASPMSTAVTAETIYVDYGFHAMSA